MGRTTLAELMDVADLISPKIRRRTTLPELMDVAHNTCRRTTSAKLLDVACLIFPRENHRAYHVAEVDGRRLRP